MATSCIQYIGGYTNFAKYLFFFFYPKRLNDTYKVLKLKFCEKFNLKNKENGEKGALISQETFLQVNKL